MQQKQLEHKKLTTLQTAIDNEATARQNADLDLGSKYNNLDNRITGFEANLQDETNARLSADTALENAIAVISDSYASKDYVDGKTAETFSSAVSSAVTDSKDYTNEQVDTVETELKHYCDTGHTELQEAISANATRINAITNWNGQGDYHDDGNGILDVLHREFHELVDVIDPEAINRKFNTISGAVDANTAAIAAETNLREQADGALDGKIDSFYEEYQAEIQSLQDQIDELKRIISGDTPTPTPTGDSVHYGHEYVDLGLPSGTKWAKMNVGAASETAYGNYYQYGKGNAIYNSHASNYSGMEDPLASSADTATQAWGGDWHTPTKEQCDELMSNTNAEWINVDGVWGAKLTSLVYGNTNYIFIPAAGNMYQDEIHNDGQEDGSGGAHVSVSTPIAGDGLRSYVMTLGYGFKRIQNVFTRAYGLSVRPVFED